MEDSFGWADMMSAGHAATGHAQNLKALPTTRQNLLRRQRLLRLNTANTTITTTTTTTITTTIANTNVIHSLPVSLPEAGNRELEDVWV